MRIVGGSKRGVQLKQPPSNITRPLTDRAKEALFNILGDIDDLVMLDLYAGSGAIGLEAISRGVKQVDAVERSHLAAKVIQDNVARLGFGKQYRLHVTSVENWLKGASISQYDLIFFGPPFKQLNIELLKMAATLLRDEGTMVVHHSRRITALQFKEVTLLMSRTYGDNALSFYHRTLEKSG